jgi:hypothetical protein
MDEQLYVTLRISVANLQVGTQLLDAVAGAVTATLGADVEDAEVYSLYVVNEDNEAID